MTEALAPAMTPISSTAQQAEVSLANLRDLGDLPVACGTVRRHMLWRSDDITLAPASQLTGLVELGLTTVLDLRSPGELQSTGHGPARQLGIAHHHLPLTKDTGDPAALTQLFAAISTPEEVGDWYDRLFRAQASRLVAALEIMAETEGGVLFHCAAGKDRTGVLAAAVLSVLGATPETITADYALTHTNMEAVMARLAGHGHATTPEVDILDRFAGHPMMGAHSAAMAGMLTALEDDGGAVAVLRAAGLTDQLSTRLREKLIQQ
ncbi:hypothetical protein GCM10011374_24330 [Kocuria dechangensis]|uniref:Tyrosine specific protein phosphatases domain-containing protein n=1 Tax=Kocuria dechangensis TaxID=1176249 RepID=A0A917LVY2_9MICC|nr:tyrosine-protein phosphatase [Kocuria dechangensis]GGG60598.1 hypothetical protein GCM10011374_24330 [Kocuria dechangensis]